MNITYYIRSRFATSRDEGSLASAEPVNFRMSGKLFGSPTRLRAWTKDMLNSQRSIIRRTGQLSFLHEKEFVSRNEPDKELHLVVVIVRSLLLY